METITSTEVSHAFSTTGFNVRVGSAFEVLVEIGNAEDLVKGLSIYRELAGDNINYWWWDNVTREQPFDDAWMGLKDFPGVLHIMLDDQAEFLDD